MDIYSLPAGTRLASMSVPAGNYRSDGMALDAERQRLFLVPFEPGGDLYEIDLAGPVLSATYGESAISRGFETGGAVAVHAPSGDVLLANGNENRVGERLLRVRIQNGNTDLIRSWTAGSDPSALAYDRRNDLLLAASRPSQSLTVLRPDLPVIDAQAPLAVLPNDLVYDASRDLLYLLTEGAEIFVLKGADGGFAEKRDSNGLSPAAGIHLDPKRGRLLAGRFGEGPPAVYDADTLALAGLLPEAGSALAVESRAGLLFQTSVTFQQPGSLKVLDALDGSVTHVVPATDTLSQTLNMAVDVTLGRVYGGTAGAHAGIWVYDWPDRNLAVYPTPPGPWTAFPFVRVDRTRGRVIAAGRQGLEWRLVAGGADDPSSLALPLPELDTLAGIAVDGSDGTVYAAGTDLAARSLLVSADVSGQGGPQTFALPGDITPAALALDESRGVLWVASSLPSGLLRIPLVSPQQPKGAPPVVTAGGTAESVFNRLHWTMEPAPPPNARITLWRNDGPLGEFYSLLPAPLPPSATEYCDADVLPGTTYTYQVRLLLPGETVISPDVTLQAVGSPDRGLRVRNLTSLLTLPPDSTGTLTLNLLGPLRPRTPTTVTIGAYPGAAAVRAKITGPATVIPGLLPVSVAVDPSASAGVTAIPLRIRRGADHFLAWVFVRVAIPFGTEPLDIPPEPPARRIQMHTDFSPGDGNGGSIVFKCAIDWSGLPSDGGKVILNVTDANGRLLARRESIAGIGLGGLPLRLAEASGLDRIRARFTWPGSALRRGNSSPILTLPLTPTGALQKDADPGGEVAFVVVGATPGHTDTPPAAGGIEELTALARATLLADLKEAPAPVIGDASALLDALQESASAPLAALYLVGDTLHADDGILLRDGKVYPYAQLADTVRDAGLTQLVVIVEGPRSARILDAGIPPEVTVVTSSNRGDAVNIMEPWDNSFSALFFNALAGNRSVVDAYWQAEVGLGVNPVGGQVQHPQLQPGDHADALLFRRFVPGVLPDLTAPAILDLRVDEEEGTLAAEVRDNRDAPEDLEVTARFHALSGETEAFDLAAGPGGNPHTGPLPAEEAVVRVAVVARDSAGNQSDPVVFWVGDALAFFDRNRDGVVGAHDYLLWQQAGDAPYEGWIFEFSQAWEGD